MSFAFNTENLKKYQEILSCYEDANGKLEKAKQGLLHIFNKWEYQPEIETLLLHPADDFHLGGYRYFYY